ncbi:MAG TPA: Lrp/AsnC family transcriptional regulator [Candidatus Micrarchaeota archaeon]|nr:Lrp/AsnC family transcriptional regulator [Candidatus Micrarchaeota archaeon]
MDKIDNEILKELQADAKSGIKKIARKTGVPMSTVHHRITRMQSEGVIRRYTVVPDYKQAGIPVCAYVFITVGHSGLASQETVAREIRKIDNVSEANIVSGEIDIIAKIRAASVEEIGTKVIGRIREIKGVEKTVTSIVMREIE